MSVPTLEQHLVNLREPIEGALGRYQALAGEAIKFDLENAAILEPIIDGRYSARSKTIADLGEGVTTDLVVIAFLPQDGTGDESTYNWGDLLIPDEYTCNLPKGEPAPKLLPRRKVGIHSEVHMALLEQYARVANVKPYYFSGTLDVLGVIGGSVQKIAEVGAPQANPQPARDPSAGKTVTTYTVIGPENSHERQVDPHAIYYPKSKLPAYLQNINVSAFMAISHEVAAARPGLFDCLRPQLPYLAQAA